MLKKAINNVRRMASHPTLPYCKFTLLKKMKLSKEYIYLLPLFLSMLLFCTITAIYYMFEKLFISPILLKLFFILKNTG